MMELTKMRHTLTEIFQAGLQRVDPFQMISNHVRLEGSLLIIDFEDAHQEVDLQAYQRLFLLGAGKASASMAAAFEAILGDWISQGLIVVKYGHTAPLAKVEIIEAGHPEPDENGVQGATRLLELARMADEETLIISLISGGGSALLPFPMSFDQAEQGIQLSLADKQAVTQLLLKCGADITEINCVRKHLSGIKGGRLLQQMYPARSFNFILSDVVGDDLSSIASGLTTFDPSTYADALAVFEKYAIVQDLPQSVGSVLQLGCKEQLPETLKPGHPALDMASNILIGTNSLAMAAAGKKAASLGFHTTLLTTRVRGEAKEVAQLLAGVGLDIRSSEMLSPRPACIISGGEPIVTIRGTGKGGRNQEMALAFLGALQRNPSLFKGISFLAASTDGNDGPTDAAGAFADLEILKRAQENHLSIKAYLQNNDSYHFFEAVQGLYTTGPTNTNVCDLHILLVE